MRKLLRTAAAAAMILSFAGACYMTQDLSPAIVTGITAEAFDNAEFDGVDTLYLANNFTNNDVQRYKSNSKVKKIVCRSNAVLPDDCRILFQGMSYVRSIDLSEANASYVTKMDSMFANCSALENVNFGSSFNTYNVTSMSLMFSECGCLEQVDISGFKLTNMEDMSGMFLHCHALKTVKASGINTSNVRYMQFMFQECRSLENVDLSGFDTSNVERMDHMFEMCQSIKSLDLTAFRTQNVYKAENMFGGCSALKTITIHEFNKSSLAYSDNMFAGCTSLVGGAGTKYSNGYTNSEAAFPDYAPYQPGYFTQRGVTLNPDTGVLTLSGDKFTKDDLFVYREHDHIKSVAAAPGTVLPEDCSNMFDRYSHDERWENLESVDLHNADTSRVTDMSDMFRNCTKLKEIDTSTWDTSNVTNMGGMFLNCNSITEIDTSRWNTSKVTKINNMFARCRSLRRCDLSNFDTSSIEDISSLFCDCVLLEEVDVSSFDTSRVHFFDCMFENCSLLKEIDISSFDTSSAWYTDRMFYNCSSLETIYAGSKWDMTDVQDCETEYMFDGCNKLTGGMGTNFTDWTRIVGKRVAHIDGGPSNPGLFTAKPLSDVKFSHNVNLSNSLGIVYYIPESALYGLSDIKLTLKKDTFKNGVKGVSTTVLTNYTIEDSNYGTEYVFRYNAISAKEIGSSVSAVLSGTKNGKTYSSDTDVYSIKNYAMNKLNKSGTAAKLKTLLVDMLNYGAESQRYFGYNTSALANNELSADQKNLATAFSNSMITSHAKETKISSPKAKFSGKTLNLGTNVAIVYFMTFDSSVNTSKVELKLTYTTVLGDNKTFRIPYSKFTNGDYAGELRYDFTSLAAKDSMQPVEAVILENGKAISSTITYSIPTYAKNKLDKSTTSDSLKSIIKAMMVYYTSAKNYLA